MKRVPPQLTLLGASLALSACAGPASTEGEPSWSTAFPGKADIYGEDSRRELNDPSVPDALRALSQSVAMVYNTYSLSGSDDDHIFFSRATMSSHFQREKGVPLCEDEPFATQVAPGYCTAFLIAPDLVATAGHCVNGHTRCAQMGFVFDYAKVSPNEDPVRVPLSKNYRCESIVGRLYNPFEEPEMISNGEYWYDWAVLKLDRPVTDRKPVKIADGAFLERGRPLTVLGHPSGLPMKVTEGEVMSEDKERYFNSTLDIYQGNSGSPTFDVETGEVHGIVIRGSGGNSFEIGPATRPNGRGGFEILAEQCGRSKRCDQVGAPGCIGNHVLRIDPVRPFISEDLLVTERHSLVEQTEELGFRYSFTFEDVEGVVDFATLHINGGALDSTKLRVLLHHGDQSVEMMSHPKQLPYGRWSATKFDFKGADPKGEWVIEIIEEQGANLSVEWAQVMLGYHAR